MKETFIRIVAMILCVVVVFGLAMVFVSRKPAEENGNASGVGITADTVMIEVENGEDIKADEYMYYVLNIRANYEQQHGEAVWKENPELSGTLLEQLDAMLLDNQAFLNWGAKEGFDLGDEDKQLFDQRIEELTGELEEGVSLDDYFKSSNLTIDLFRKIFNRDLYIDRFLTDYMTPEHPYMAVSDEELDAYIEENGVLGAKHIHIQNDEGDDPEANRALAEELLGRIRAGEEFDDLMEEYTEDPGYADYPNGYVFEKGETVPEFENAVTALEIGETSEVVESDTGYHIIRRIEIIRDDAVMKIQQQRLSDTYLGYLAKITAEKTEARNALTIPDAVPVL